ncbi:MAG TPA: hypothetical protein VEX69_10760 [Candidatus Limnocylindria bacterium]|nr:hypothetical protein [Candidatus Limnocylindria bacterium]
MRTTSKACLVASGLILSAVLLPRISRAQDDAKHQHHGDMTSRGDSAMGFDAAKTTHHFLQTSSGGTIQVAANDPADTASRDAIQHHLQHIAQHFKEGDFDIPMFVHDQMPPGVPVMKRLKAEISYQYVAMDHGGRVEISTKNPEALAAIHDFLRFQIQEHHTGDKQ